MFINKTHPLLKFGFLLAGMFVALFLGIFTYQITTNASSVSWHSTADPVLIENPEYGLDVHAKSCKDKDVQIDDRAGHAYFGPSNSTNTCVYDKGKWRYALTNRSYRYWNSTVRIDDSFAISIGDDQKMYRVNNLSAQDIPVFTANSDGLVYAKGGIGYGKELVAYTDLTRRLVKYDNDSYTIMDVDAPDFIFKRPNGHILPVGAAVSSPNGKWLAFEAIGIGIMRLNLETYELKRISNVAPRYGVGANPHMSLAISDKGDNVVIGGEITPFNIYTVTATCGDKITDELVADISVAVPCLEKRVGEYLESILPSGLAAATFLRFGDDAGEVKFTAYLNSDRTRADGKNYVLRAPGYVPTPRLDYLAMGDSFSSGEGDTDVVRESRYYLAGTDIEGGGQIPTEKCHISSRSYPYLLKASMNLSNDKMESVTCSGAQRVDIQGAIPPDIDYKNTEITSIYRGQTNIDHSGAPVPRLRGFPNFLELQVSALENLTPGRIQQINFVEKYKPRVITLTFGGNDIGFGAILDACIRAGKFVLTCSHAKDEGIGQLGSEIRGQYTNFRDVYERLQGTNPDARTYVLGYPQFISQNGICGLNPTLNNREREMMREGVSYLNLVIKAAASDAGVKYVDIEDSLGEHILCGKEESYVNGLGTAMFGQVQESYHPNAKGHALMYAGIQKGLTRANETLLNSTDCNDIIVCPTAAGARLSVMPDFFVKPVTDYNKIAKRVDMVVRGAKGIAGGVVQGADKLTTGIVTRVTPYIIEINPLALMPNTVVNVELHSSPVQLGTFMSDMYGGLQANFTVPNEIPAGYHTLHVYGNSYTGHAIDYYQIVRVHGAVGDVDEDGIPDDRDHCYFIQESNIDADKDGIDDSCDMLIEHQAPQENLKDEYITARQASLNINSRLSNTNDNATAVMYGDSYKVLGLTNSAVKSADDEKQQENATHYIARSQPMLPIIIMFCAFTAIVYVASKLRK